MHTLSHLHAHKHTHTLTRFPHAHTHTCTHSHTHARAQGRKMFIRGYCGDYHQFAAAHSYLSPHFAIALQPALASDYDAWAPSLAFMVSKNIPTFVTGASGDRSRAHNAMVVQLLGGRVLVPPQTARFPVAAGGGGAMKNHNVMAFQVGVDKACCAWHCWVRVAQSRVYARTECLPERGLVQDCADADLRSRCDRPLVSARLLRCSHVRLAHMRHCHRRRRCCAAGRNDSVSPSLSLSVARVQGLNLAVQHDVMNQPTTAANFASTKRHLRSLGLDLQVRSCSVTAAAVAPSTVACSTSATTTVCT
jgi:hypothetical protein